MASGLIFLHHHNALKQRGRLRVGWKVIGCAYPGYRPGRSSWLKGTGEWITIREQLTPWDEKSRLWSIMVTVPQTDTGTPGENPKACEITTAKELGKITP